MLPAAIAIAIAIAAADEAMRATFGNPSSGHSAGLRARARRVVGAGSGQLAFTSGATEGIHTAVLSALCALRERRAAGLPCGDLLLYRATEHKAVPDSLAHWNRLLGAGFELRALPVEGDGRHRRRAKRDGPATQCSCVRQRTVARPRLP